MIILGADFMIEDQKLTHFVSDTGTDTELPERLRGYGGTRTLATRDSGTGWN